MATSIISNLKYLVNTRKQDEILRGTHLSNLPIIENAWIKIEDGFIASYGEMNDLKTYGHKISTVVDGQGTSVLPCWCDSHTHLVFASFREGEFVDKIK